MDQTPHDNTTQALNPEETPQEQKMSRRSWLAMGVGLAAAYGLLAIEGIAFILPKRIKAPTRKLFAGLLAQFPDQGVKEIRDLQGKTIIVRRNGTDLKAFSTICPHLGCQVHWQDKEQKFFCPCHGGVFNPEGVAIAGPPFKAGQSLSQVPLTVDAQSGVVYMEVADQPQKGHS